jgi:ClpP class serine protease
MAQHETARFAPHGLLALDPKAFGLEFLIGRPDMSPSLVADGKAAVVRICGPLCFSGFLFDTYDAIRGRVRSALASEASTVILAVDSPGGEVAGCFDCARGIRADANAAGKRLVVFVASQACSAAYALAATADEIVVSDTAVIGSIGVIHEMQSVVRADAASGHDFAFVTSGSKKAYGNPHTPISEEALAETQRTVDATAARFFALVLEMRAKVKEPEGLQAGVLVGAAAVIRGLADRVSTWDALVGAIQASTPESAAAPEQASKMDPDKKDDDATRAALVKDSTSDDAKKAARAKKALAAYDDGDGDEKKDDKATSSAAAPAAEFPKKDDEKKDDKAIAAASSLAGAVASQASEIAALKASLQARDAKDAAVERAAFFAQHAGLPEALLKSLEPLPLEQCRTIVAAVPAQFRSRAVSPEVGATRGATQGDTAKADFLASPLAARMHVVKTEPVVAMDQTGTVQQFGVQKVKA